MSCSNIPKAVLSAPSKEERNNSEDNTHAALRSARLYEIARTNGQQGLQDMHQNRIKMLRKELDYIKETEWKYDPIDKFIGQSNH